MPDTTAPLLWLLAAASACLGLLVSNSPAAPKGLPSFYSLPWWQDITAQYRLSEGVQVSPSFPAEDCVSILLTGEGFHQIVRYELTCSPNLLFASTDVPIQSGEITILQTFPPELFADPYELEQSRAVLAGSVEVALFGQIDLEQPAPVCHPTVLGITLRNVTQRAKKRDGRSVYHTFELPFHAKYPAPVDGGEGCASDSILNLSPGPVRRVQWTPPLLLLRTGGHDDFTARGETEEGHGDKPSEPDAESEASAAAEEAPSATSLVQIHEQQQPSQQQQAEGGERQRYRARGSARHWSVMRVRLLLPEVVDVPTGCLRHASLVSGVTLGVALICSAAMVTAALC